MPVTPFHFGPGAAIHAVAPKHVSFLAFFVVNVVIDVEPLYFMLTRQAHLHRFLHTYPGATLAAVFTIALFLAARHAATRWRLPEPFAWQSLGLVAVTLGALAGAWSHVALDSVMHADITPLAPFSDANPLFRIVSLWTLHAGCVGAGILALGALGIRALLERRRGSAS